jgi:hypothetical protein
MAKRPSPPPSYGGEDKTIQAMELGARRQAVLAVWPGWLLPAVPRSVTGKVSLDAHQGSHPMTRGPGLTCQAAGLLVPKREEGEPP